MIIGCWFHFGQCLFRKLVEIGLKSIYSQDTELKKTFKNCVALALMPKNKVCDIFLDMIVEKSQSLMEKYPSFQDFIEYMTNTWIDDAIFPIDIWNHWNKDIGTRTNNNNEAYNFRLDSKLSKSHPNIWSFIEMIQAEESFMAVNYHRIENGNLKSRGRCKKDLIRDLLISNAQNDYLTSMKTYEDLEILLETLSQLTPDYS